MAFMPFVTAGDPDLRTTVELIRLLRDCGVDLIEVGFPYSDPIADGPVIQASYTRALAKKVRLPDIFAALRRLRGESIPAAVGDGRLRDRFSSRARAVRSGGPRGRLLGADRPRSSRRPGGGAVPTWRGRTGSTLSRWLRRRRPPSESTGSCNRRAALSIACRSPARRAFAKCCPRNWHSSSRNLRTKTKLPLAVGFGIGRPEQIDSLRGLADGVIVGSALVRQIGRLSGPSAAPRAGSRRGCQIRPGDGRRRSQRARLVLTALWCRGGCRSFSGHFRREPVTR